MHASPARSPRSLPFRCLLALVSLATLGVAAEPAVPGPLVEEFPVATLSALLRPAVSQRLTAPITGRFRVEAAAGPVAAGAVLGRFADAELRAALETAQLRLRAAQRQEADFAAEAPTRRQEAQARITDLEGRLGLAEAVAKDPSLLRELPAANQAALLHADPAALRAQLDAARAALARLETPEFIATSAARLQVRDAERAVREAEARVADAVVTAPFAGVFQPATDPGGNAGALVGAGQELGTLRDLTHLVAAVPVLSPYLSGLDPQQTRLRLTGPGGKAFSAPFREAVTEPTPALGEMRVLLFEFSVGDSRELAALVQTTVTGHLVLRPARPVALVDKLRAALDHPDSFREGWAAGAARVWPGWTLVCEGETALGLAPVDHR